MADENRDFIDLFENDEENTVKEMPSEAANQSDATNDRDENEKTLTEEICEPVDEQPENKDNLCQKNAYEFILKELNMLKEQNVIVLSEIQKLTDKKSDEEIVAEEKNVYEKYRQNLKDFQDTFTVFESQLPQLILQLRTELKTGPGNDYKQIIEEAAANYGNLKKAIGNDINKAIETWNKVRGGEKERQKIERLLLIIAIMQAAITIRLLWNYFMGV